MEDTYRELKRFFADLHFLMVFIGDIGSGKGKRIVDSEYFEEAEECYNKMRKEGFAEEEFDDFMHYMEGMSESETKIALLNLLGCRTSFSDDVTLDFCKATEAFHKEDRIDSLGKQLPSGLSEEKWKLLEGMSSMVTLLFIRLQEIIKMICSAKNITDMEAEFEKFHQSHQKASFIFGKTMPESETQEYGEKEMKKLSQGQLLYIMCALASVDIKGLFPPDAVLSKATPQKKTAEFMADLFGGSANAYRTRIGEIASLNTEELQQHLEKAKRWLIERGASHISEK